MVVQALAANSIQFGCGGPEPFMESSDRGLDFIITGGVINGMTAAIVAGKKYKSFEDLRGTTVGSSALTRRHGRRISRGLTPKRLGISARL